MKDANWISVQVRLPNKEDADEYGNVLIFRETNKGQEALSKSIYPFNMVKYSDNKTFWCSLPPNP